MVYWGLVWLFIYLTAEEASLAAQASSIITNPDAAADGVIKDISKPKHHKKKHKSKKKRVKKHRKKQKAYSVQKLEKLLDRDKSDGKCTRLACSSKLEVAKSCLKSKADHRIHKDCFHAFCAYGCNDEDYTSRPEVQIFCKQTCSSRKYQTGKGQPELSDK